jgi:hypothetical protein
MSLHKEKGGSAHISKMVYVEARIDIYRSSDYVVPHITAWCRVVGCSELARRRECKSFLHERKVAALLRSFVDRRHEGLVQCENIRIIVQGSHSRYYQWLALHLTMIKNGNAYLPSEPN